MVSTRFRPSFVVLAVLSLLVADSVRADIVISEFMAINDTVLEDENREFPDWLEIHNDGDETVNLEGWQLTDNPLATKWTFPAMEIAPHDYLIVFCSGGDRRDPTQPLHANFKLQGDGEYLGLLDPNGFVAWQFTPTYTSQVADVSYGYPQSSEETRVVESMAPGKYFVPADGSLGLDWVTPEFADADWIAGATAFGFDRRTRPTFDDLVQTDVGDAMYDINATAYIRVPFTVEDPAAFDLLELRMRYEDGFIAYLNGVEVARANAPDDSTWDSQSAGRQSSSTSCRTACVRIAERIPLTPFLLVAGENLLAIHGLNDRPNNNEFLIDPELVGIRLDRPNFAELHFFEAPTPGFPNGGGVPGISGPVTFSVPSGAYEGSATVELSVNPAAPIRYTLDGSIPDEGSALYEAPLSITDATIVRARAFQDGLLRGRVAEASYIMLHPSVVDVDSNLPLAICTTFGRTIGGNCGSGNYTPGHFMLITPDPEDGRAQITDVPNFAGSAGFRKRGSSTCGRPKFSFNVEIWDEEREDRAAKILEEFPIDSDYVMYGPYNFDRALMRNPIAYWMNREAGRWAARTRFVETYFHSRPGPVISSSYFGVYALMEKNKQHAEKVNVAQMTAQDNEPPEVTGGYILKRDRSSSGEQTTSAGGYNLVFVYPKIPTSAQRTYITNYINSARGTLSPNIGSQDDSNVIDVLSWIDHHILNWYPKNVDAFRLSGYLHKDRNGLWAMGPSWDYDRSMGSTDGRDRTPTGWANDQQGDGGTDYFESTGIGSQWYGTLFQNRPPALPNTPWNRAYQQRWRELRSGALATANIWGQLDEWAAELAEAAPRNSSRWGGGRPFQQEVDHLKTWLGTRAEWIDSQFIPVPIFSHEGGNVEAPFELTITNPSEDGEIYYTLDRSDPRMSNGTVSASAILYQGPITITENTKVAARLLVGGGTWSGLVEGVYVVSIPTLAITELMFNPPGGTTFEFLELHNYGDEPVELAGAGFGRGVTFAEFDPDTPDLAPGEYTVIVSNLAAFSSIYNTANIRIDGEYGGNLSNNGETINLVGTATELIVGFRYDDAWYPETDGLGHSLVLNDPKSDPETWSGPEAWRPSLIANGSPGAEDPLELPTFGQIAGDISQDGKLNITDAILLLRFLFGLGGIDRLPCGAGSVAEASNILLLNTNGDFQIDQADVVYNLQYMFGGPAPVQGTECTAIQGCATVCDVPVDVPVE